MFSPQIHIVFNSKEDTRITKPILENPPNKLYYFTTYIKKTKQKDGNLIFFQKNTNLLLKKIPSLKIIKNEVDYTNYIEIIQELSKIIKSEREENKNCKIFINVSSGSKMTSLASIEASKLWDCNVYYLFSSIYKPDGEGARHKGNFHIFSPITFPINKPDETYIITLKLIKQLIDKKYSRKYNEKKQNKFIYMKYLIEKLESEGLVLLDKENEDSAYRKSALYMKARHFLNPLIKTLKYIELSDDHRNKKVFINERGEDVLQIFKFLI
ncbi:hypothetical protein ES705_08049 [subsurface metagenome]